MDYYTTSGRTYMASYQSLKDDYRHYRAMSDEEFIANSLDILHFCCITAYFKELPSYLVLEDDGLIHELVHLQLEGVKDDTLNRLKEIRQSFNDLMELA